MLWGLLGWIFALVGFLSLVTYYVPYLIVLLLPEQDLKKKYNATWAIVTGGSSGIGKAICTRLATQGLNVVIAALDDKLLHETHEQLQKQFPKVEIRKVGVNLTQPGYVETIAEATRDIPISIVFNNAGFIVTGFFANLPIERCVGNYECNATAAMRLTHHFANRMLDEKRKGLICFTSSPASRMPNPSSALYGSTKAFLTEFAASLAPELYGDGIDVLVLNPSPIDSNFYKDAHKTGAIEAFKKTVAPADVIASYAMKCAGRVVICDQGYFPAVQKLLLLVLDFNLFAWITCLTSGNMADFKKMHAERQQKSKKE